MNILSESRLFAEQLPESIIKRYSIRIKARNGINFGQGIPSFPTAPHIIAAASRALSERGIGVYPNFLGTIELRTAIAEKLNGDHALQLKAAEHVLVTVGAMEATASVIFSLINNGERAGVLTPDYCNHFPQLQLARARIVEIPLQERHGWQLDFDVLKKQMQRGLKLLLLTNPNNPTGWVIPRQDMRELVRLAAQYGTWVVADETYSFLTYDTPFTSLLDCWNDYDRLITVRSFSKEYAMTGWRVGYVVTRPEVLEVFAKTHDALTGCVPKISQYAALEAVTGPQDIVTEYRNFLRKRRDAAISALTGMRDVLSFNPPQGAYYIFPRYRVKESSMALTERILTAANVAVIPGSVFGKAGERHFRISFAVSDEVLTQGFQQLHQFFAAGRS